MNEIGKTSLLALSISIPISLIGSFLSMGLAHSTGFVLFLTKVLFLPFFVLGNILDAFGIENLNNTAHIILALISQFLGYFIVIYLIRGIYRYAKNKNT